MRDKLNDVSLTRHRSHEPDRLYRLRVGDDFVHTDVVAAYRP